MWFLLFNFSGSQRHMVDEAIEFIKKHKLNSASSISAALS